MSLDAFQIPHDHDSKHQLHWTPGKHGKGLIEPDGTLHHWSVGDHEDGNPTHRQYMQEKNLGDPWEIDPAKRPQANRMFWITPEGTVEALGSGATWGDPDRAEAYLKEVQAVDPRLGPIRANEWHFGGVEDQSRGMSDADIDDWIEALVRSVTPKQKPETVEQAKLREQREKLGPIGYEQYADWDHDGDTFRHRDVEWVPTHVLKDFMEYDRQPGGKDATNPERYEALKEHIRQNGFKNPIQLEANMDESHAHMGEGNHRAAIALELGIPAMPVRVNRSTRRSPTKVPIRIDHDSFPKDHMGQPWHTDSMKPSQIGLPTVPPPGAQPEQP